LSTPFYKRKVFSAEALFIFYRFLLCRFGGGNLIFHNMHTLKGDEMKKKVVMLAGVICCCFFCQAAYGKVDKKALAKDIDSLMIENYLKKYFPKIIDQQYGGFHGFYDRQFNPVSLTAKSTNMMARHLFSSSVGMMLHPEYTGFEQAAKSGYDWIKDKCWDKTQGGVYGGKNREGTANDNMVGQYGVYCDKPTYHNGFTMYGMSFYYLATGDTMALSIAKDIFRFFDSKAHDNING
jgi:mannobiose 2-epimerase